MYNNISYSYSYQKEKRKREGKTGIDLSFK